MSNHLSDDQLVDRFYGLASKDDAHLNACALCQSRWTKLQRCHTDATGEAGRSPEFFHQQRRRIFGRLAAPVSSLRANLMPVALALLLMLGLVVSQPMRTGPPTSPQNVKATQIIEAGWFEDTYSATRVLEPRATSPIRELFSQGPVLQ
jgi:hypothetical protein